MAFIVFLLFPLVCGAQKTSAVFSISGITIESGTGEKIPGVAVNLEDTGIWTTSDDNGRFVLTDIRPGTYRLVFSCFGYVDRKLDFTVKADIGSLTIKMNQNSLALNGVTVTAERDKDGLNTSTKFGSNALEHLQMSNVTDISALLPGGKTVNPDLTSDNRISVRSGGLAYGNASFGTALEVDGVRVGNNASFGQMTGSGT